MRTIEGMHRGDVKVFVGMGGNFVLAAPDTALTMEALRRTRADRAGEHEAQPQPPRPRPAALILPCLGRTEQDQQRGGLQGTSVEDSMSMVHLSHGMKAPASPHLRSEPAIIAGMAHGEPARDEDAVAGLRRRLRPHPRHDGQGARRLRRLQRARARRQHGFRIPQPARERVFLTPSRPRRVLARAAARRRAARRPPVLGTVRSHDQWNTTIYCNDDRYRGVKNLRTLVFMNRADMEARGLEEMTSSTSRASAATARAGRSTATAPLAYDIPQGNAAGYMPELNVLCPIGDFSRQCDQPLMKHLVVEIVPAAAPAV